MKSFIQFREMYHVSDVRLKKIVDQITKKFGVDDAMDYDNDADIVFVDVSSKENAKKAVQWVNSTHKDIEAYVKRDETIILQYKNS